MNACASGIDIGSVGGVVCSTPCRASAPSAATLFMVCRKRLICFLPVERGIVAVRGLRRNPGATAQSEQSGDILGAALGRCHSSHWPAKR